MSKSRKWKDVDQALLEALERGVFPCAVLLVSKQGRVEYLKTVGRISANSKESLDENAVFDVASLTKVLCNTTLIMSLVAESKIDLGDKLEKYFGLHEITEELGRATIEDVLNHSAGIKSYVPFFNDVMKKGNEFVGTKEAREFIFKSARMEKLDYKRNEHFEYSDLGFIILTEIIEKIQNKGFDDVCDQRIFKKLSMSKSAFVRWRERKSSDIFKGVQVVPTEFYPWLGTLACGVVHDENCYAMGGVSGHAGLFTTAMDVKKFIDEVLKGWGGKSRLMPKELCQRFFKKRGVVQNSPWALGWKTSSKEDLSSGNYFSPNSIGHLGYTGCSIWIDLDDEIAVVLLSNRVNPTRENIKIREFRPKIHNLVLKILKDL